MAGRAVGDARGADAVAATQPGAVGAAGCGVARLGGVVSGSSQVSGVAGAAGLGSLSRAGPAPAVAGDEAGARAPYVAAYLVKLDQEKRYMSDLRRYLVEHPALVWVLGFPLVASESSPWGFDVEASVPSRKQLGGCCASCPTRACSSCSAGWSRRCSRSCRRRSTSAMRCRKRNRSVAEGNGGEGDAAAAAAASSAPGDAAQGQVHLQLDPRAAPAGPLRVPAALSAEDR